MIPYKEVFHDGYSIRTFAADVDGGELKWHWDEEDRTVIPYYPGAWQLQLDNELPIMLEHNKEYFIPKGKFHRIIRPKQNRPLTVRIIRGEK